MLVGQMGQCVFVRVCFLGKGTRGFGLISAAWPLVHREHCIDGLESKLILTLTGSEQWLQITNPSLLLASYPLHVP